LVGRKRTRTHTRSAFVTRTPSKIAHTHTTAHSRQKRDYADIESSGVGSGVTSALRWVSW
jgi:hypothetical protein